MKKDLKLSKEEKNRIDKFSSLKDSLLSKGYSFNKVTSDILKANVIAIFIMIISAVIMVFTYNQIYDIQKQFFTFMYNVDIMKYLLLLFALFVIQLILVVVHELIHGVSWSLFAENGFKSIEFGYIKEKFTPYCYCYSPLNKWQYLFGLLMPLIVLGIIPAIYAYSTGNLIVLFLSWIMIASASGDMIIAYKILLYKNNKNESLIFDHPIEMGVTIFEKS